MDWSYFSYTLMLEENMKRNVIFAIFAIGMGILAISFAFAYQYFYPERYIRTSDGSYQNVAAAQTQTPFPVSKETMFIMEYYDKETDRLLTEKIDGIPALLGCDQAGVERYLMDYMKHIPKEEQEKGLVSYTLTSYKGNTLYFRKTYDQPVYTGYYAKSFNGYVVILNGDEKTVFEYTQIPINELPEDIRSSVMAGYYLDNETDLYNFLENYSS